VKTGVITYTKLGRKGQTIVEFALILFLLLAMLFGITEFGRAWYFSNALTNGVRAGSRYAATLSNNTSYENKVRNYTMGQITSVIPIDSLAVTVAPAFTGVTSGTPVTVTASYDFVVLTGSIVPFFSGTKVMTRQATMRHE